MKKVIKTVFLGLVLLLSNSAFSQNALSIQAINAVSIPSTIQIGNAFDLDVQVKNDSAASFIGAITFYYRIDTSNYVSADTTSGLNFIVQTDSLGFGDTIGRIIHVKVTGPQFKVGPSVVVIWPVANGAFAKDSIKFGITITDTATAIAEVDNRHLKLFVSENSLWVDKDAEIQLRRVRIFDVLGQQILDKSNPADNIPLPEMSKGIYLAEVTYDNNRRKIFRFYH